MHPIADIQLELPNRAASGPLRSFVNSWDEPVHKTPMQDTMSIDLVYQAIYQALDLSDSTLQIWMTYTFAIIAAAHLAGDRIGGTTYKLVSGLYGLYAGVLVVKYLGAAHQILHYQDIMDLRGFEPWPVPKPIGIVIGAGTLLLMVGGMIATLWFVNKIRRENNASA